MERSTSPPVIVLFHTLTPAEIQRISHNIHVCHPHFMSVALRSEHSRFLLRLCVRYALVLTLPHLLTFFSSPINPHARLPGVTLPRPPRCMCNGGNHRGLNITARSFAAICDFVTLEVSLASTIVTRFRTYTLQKFGFYPKVHLRTISRARTRGKSASC